MNATLKENLDKYVHMHADCIPVKGVSQSAVYDLTRGEIVLFPSAYFETLKRFKKEKLGILLEAMESEKDKTYMIAFIEFLLENELVTFLEDPTLFPAIEEAWDIPCVIQNAIIDVNEIVHDFGKIFQELDAVGCQFVQLRSFSNVLKVADLDCILSLAYHKSMQGVELLLKYDPAIADQEYLTLVENQPIIANVTIHSSPQEMDLITSFGYTGELSHWVEKEVNFITESIEAHTHCGIINLRSLSAPSVNSFFENKLYNGCLNRKVSVDAFGEIKNCPSMEASFGNYNSTRLDHIIYQPAFQEKWNITKDQIKVCQDCEFRYACTDCRAYTENPGDLYSKPLKCGYDPYTCTWEEWSTHELKQQTRASDGKRETIR